MKAGTAMKAMKVASGCAARSGGVARRVGAATDNYVFNWILWSASVFRTASKVFWGVMVPCFVLAYLVSRFTPGLWYYHEDTAMIDFDRVYWMEVLLLSSFFMLTYYLNWVGTLNFSRQPLRSKVPEEIGYAGALGAVSTALWSPRGTAVVFGLFSLGAFRRAGAHFTGLV